MNTNASTTCARMSETFVTYHSQVSALGLPLETLIKFNLNDISVIVRSFNKRKGETSDMKRETIWSSELVPKTRRPETDTHEQIYAPFEQLVNKWTLGTEKNHNYYYEVFVQIMWTPVTNNETILFLYLQACEGKTNELQESDYFCLSLIKKTGEMGAVTITVKNEVLVIILYYTICSCVLRGESISTQVKNEHMMVCYAHLIFWLISIDLHPHLLRFLINCCDENVLISCLYIVVLSLLSYVFLFLPFSSFLLLVHFFLVLVCLFC